MATKKEKETGVKITKEQEKALQEAVKENLAAERDPASVVKDTTKESMVSKENAVNVLDESVAKQVSRMGRQTAEKLRNSPKEKVLIPKDKLNMNDEYVVVGINGWNLQIQRGVPVILPRQVVNLLAQAGYGPTLVR